MATDPYKSFRVEAQELLEGLTQGALELEKGAADRAMVGSLLRLAHTLKGAARVVRQHSYWLVFRRSSSASSIGMGTSVRNEKIAPSALRQSEEHTSELESLRHLVC